MGQVREPKIARSAVCESLAIRGAVQVARVGRYIRELQPCVEPGKDTTFPLHPADFDLAAAFPILTSEPCLRPPRRRACLLPRL